MTSNNTNYAQYDDLRSTAQGIPLVSNDASHVGRNLHQVFSDDENTILCHVPIILRWTGEGNDDDVNVSNEAYGGSAAALLAMHHFNTGDSSIIDEFSHDRWRGNCPIRLTAELIDIDRRSSHRMSPRRGRRQLRDNGGGDFDDLGFDRRKREGFLNSPWDCGLMQDGQRLLAN
jgi:hypothetical protein